MTTRRLETGDLPSVLPPGGLTLVSTCSAESDLLADEVAAAGAALGKMRFTGAFVPGITRRDWRAGPDSRALTFFQSAVWRERPGGSDFLPLCYQDIGAHLRASQPSAALMMVSPPDADGRCSFGAEVAFVADLWRTIPVRIAHVNPTMPRTNGDPGIPFSELTAWFEGEQPLRTLPITPSSEQSARIAARVAELVPDGATIQIGIGKLPDAVMEALAGHRNLRLHSGMIADATLRLIRSGAFAEGVSAITGVALGSAELYAGLDDPHVAFRPPSVTHGLGAMAGIERLVTINSAMSVDLFGQAYAEASGRGFESGPGGASDYARGARAADDRLRIIALPAAAGGTSRIVAPGGGRGPVSLSRFDIDVVVTEYGAADLRFKDHAGRAAALIAIAAPEHRDGLARGWAHIAKTI